MDNERLKYEIAEVWDEKFEAGNVLYEETLRQLPGDIHSLLDVGCGDGTFLHLLYERMEDEITLHGVDRSAAALSRVRVNKTQASADQISLEDRTYDCVTCMEVIEHIGVGTFDRVLSELCRVAGKYVLITVPYHENLRVSQVRCPVCQTLFNCSYHVRNFSVKDMQTLLDSDQFENVNVKIISTRKYLGAAFLKKMMRIIFRKNILSQYATSCPLCGYGKPSEKQDEGNTHNARKGRMRQIAEKAWPRRKKKSWICGVYKRKQSNA